MTKKKVTKPVKKLVVVLDLNGTYSILDDPKKRAKQRTRGPKHIGQGKIKRHLRISGISDTEMVKRIDAAIGILEKGVPNDKVPGLDKMIDELLAANKSLTLKVESLKPKPEKKAPAEPVAPPPEGKPQVSEETPSEK